MSVPFDAAWVGDSSISARDRPTETQAELDAYFLAGRTLAPPSVVSLLLSSSFGLNALFYAAALGYLMGAWALLIQISWSLSFLLLARYSETVRGVSSVHDLLGRYFGDKTKKVAAACSVVGLTYLVGWEVAIGKASLQDLGHGASRGLGGLLNPGGGLVIAVVVALAYSAASGQRANAYVDRALNLLKIVLLVGVVGVICFRILGADGSTAVRGAFPSFGSAIGAIGLTGFVTSILFNGCWQFVDNSSWQAVNSGAGQSSATRKNLLWSAVVIFGTVNFLGTVLGAVLRSAPGASTDNLLGSLATEIPGPQMLIEIGLFLLVISCVMSLVDGMFLSVSQSVVLDIGPRRAEQRSGIRLWHAKVATVLLGGLAAWGVNLVVSAFGASIFSFVYVVIIAQLGLLGPVMVALRAGRRGEDRVWIAVALSVALGMAAAAAGSVLKIQFMVDGAGALTALVSVAVAFALSRPGPRKSSSMQIPHLLR